MAKTKSQILESIEDDGYVDLGLAMHLCRLDSVSKSAVASAIEVVGVYGWDEYDRYRKFEPKDAGAIKALETLGKYFTDYRKAEFNPNIEAGFDNFWHDYDSPLQFWGWPVSELPDFKAIQDQWDRKYLGSGTKPVTKPEITDLEGRYAQIRVLIALYKIAFPDIEISDFQPEGNKRNRKFTTVKSRIDKALGGENVPDDKTIKRIFRWLATGKQNSSL